MEQIGMNGMGQSNRSWFDKPEGRVGAVGAVGIIALLVIGGYFALPFIIIALKNTLYTMFLLGGIGLILMLAIHPSSRNFFCLAYKMFFKNLTGFFITLDPIMILKDYVQQLYVNLEEMSKQVATVKGTMQNLKRKINSYTDEANQLMSRANVANEKGNKKVAITSNRAAERRRKSVQKLTALYNKIEMILRVLHKMHENGVIMAEDTKDEVELQQDEWQAIKNANSAMKSAMSVISGGGDKRANFEHAMEIMIDEVSLKMGEMENFMDMTSGLMESIDLDNDVFDDKMLKNLEAWEKKSDSWILGEDKTTAIHDAYNPEKDIDSEDLSMRDLKVNIFK